MREIKARAWDYNDKKWHTRIRIGVNCCHSIYDEERQEWFEFDEACGEIVLCTGLKDKNGKEIYEGDIVTAREQSNMATFTGYVHYLNAQYWVNYINYESYYIPLIQLRGAVYKEIEVIGNIYENSELLEAQA